MFLRNKQGDPSGLALGHTLKKAALGMSDFDLWMSKDLISAMKAKGTTRHSNGLRLLEYSKAKSGLGKPN
jgi:hypothetical protein